jgi:transcriptional regulator with XRE-family HTH domain
MACVCANAHMTPHDAHTLPPDPALRRIADLIRAERRRQGMDQRTLALVASVGVRTVHKIEQAQDPVRLDVLLRVLRALGLELDVRSRSSP